MKPVNVYEKEWEWLWKLRAELKVKKLADVLKKVRETFTKFKIDKEIK